jgi:hypothetical protein
MMNINTNINSPKCGFRSACILFVDPNNTERAPATIKSVKDVSNSFPLHTSFFENRNSPMDDKIKASAKNPTKNHFCVVKKSCVRGRKNTTTNRAKMERAYDLTVWKDISKYGNS